MINKISVIIPVYNEELAISKCLNSLKQQSYKNFEIIVVDDGSTDSTKSVIKPFGVILLEQQHKGPGTARNLGAKHAKGDILVFVDADMTFDPDFISDLILPIQEKKAIGTFSKNEMVSDSDSKWSICWNINRNVPRDRMIAKNYPDEAPVFRAILKSEFEKVNGFETSGDYADDWSLSEKLGHKSKLAQGAVYYHINPQNLSEVWQQARWIGRNRFLTGSFPRRLRTLTIHSLPISVLVALFKSIINIYPPFSFFKIIYDLGVFTSAATSFGAKNKFR